MSENKESKVETPILECAFCKKVGQPKHFDGLIRPSFCSDECKESFEAQILEMRRKHNPKSVFHDPVRKPQHYTSHKSGVECITVTEHMNFCLGNAMKYIWRAELKGGSEDLKKAIWYLNRELTRRALSGEEK